MTGVPSLADFAVGRAGEGEEHRRAEGLAVRGGVGLAHGVRADLPLRQVGGVLAAAGGPVAARSGLCRGRRCRAARDRLISRVQVVDQFIQLGGVLPGVGRAVPVGLGLGAVLDPHGLFVVGRGCGRDGLGVQVPPFPALAGAQVLGPFRARRAHAGQRGTAGHEDLVHLAGVGVGAAELDRAQARAVVRRRPSGPHRGQSDGPSSRPGCQVPGLSQGSVMGSRSASARPHPWPRRPTTRRPGTPG